MAKNYFYNLLLTLTNLLFPILSFPYVSRIIGPEGIGNVQFIFSFAQYFGLLASIGIPIYGMKEIARYKDDANSRSKVFSELMSLYLITCALLSLIYLGVIFSFPYFSRNIDMYFAAALMILLGFSNIEWLYMGLEEFKSIALRSVGFKFVGLLLLYLLVKERSDYRFYLYIMMFSFLGNNILSFFLLKGKVKPVMSGLNLRRHISPLLFIFSTTIAASMYTDMDTVILGFLSNPKTVGFYTAAVKLSKITLPFVTSLGVILMPKIAKAFAEKNLVEVQLTLVQTFHFLVFFSIPIVFGLVLLAPEFIALFSGKEFLPAANSMRLLSILPLIIGFGHLFLFLILVPAGKNKETLFCVLGGMAVSLTLNLILIPSFQEIGSSIANVISEVVVTYLYFYFIKRYFSFQFEWLLLFKAILSALIFIPMVMLIRSLSLPLLYMLLLSISTCGITYIGLQWIVFKNHFLLDIMGFIKLKFRGVES